MAEGELLVIVTVVDFGATTAAVGLQTALLKAQKLLQIAVDPVFFIFVTHDCNKAFDWLSQITLASLQYTLTITTAILDLQIGYCMLTETSKI